MNTARPKSEDPVDLIAEPGRFIPKNGYRWVAGEWGVNKPRPGVFLTSNPGEGLLAVTPPSDLYLELAQLDISEESNLAFAAKFGTLGVWQTHFHSMECPETWGESTEDWGMEIRAFQYHLELWEAAEHRDLKALERMLIIDSPTAGDDKIWLHIKKDLPKAARARVLEKINSQLKHRTYIPPLTECFMQSCVFHQVGEARGVEVSSFRWPAKEPLRSPGPRFVSYQLRTSENDGKGKGKIEGHLVSSSLLVTVWLQFAELVCGRRKLRPCNVCNRLMDVSETARPGAKRMHDRCSLAGRMRRYRSKLNSADSSGSGVKAPQIRKEKKNA